MERRRTRRREKETERGLVTQMLAFHPIGERKLESRAVGPSIKRYLLSLRVGEFFPLFPYLSLPLLQQTSNYTETEEDKKGAENRGKTNVPSVMLLDPLPDLQTVTRLRVRTEFYFPNQVP